MIETPRLLLRPHRLDDFDAFASMWQEPAVVQYISGKPSTIQQSWMRLLGYAGHWALLGYGYWAIEERASGAFIGEVGFADYHREMDGAPDGPEIGWVLAPHAHNKGYATEAVTAALGWARDSLQRFPATWCMIVPENEASVRVAEKCGLRERGRSSYAGSTVALFERPLR
ncbi:MAG TPA: GNAT family N-acetyltransferase [Candidatus Baltobacteraceae bacterium]|nr:GNAT family N-acetyltransferase [Candidatus Baltobacteraceae bacterium]